MRIVWQLEVGCMIKSLSLIFLKWKFNFLIKVILGRGEGETQTETMLDKGLRTEVISCSNCKDNVGDKRQVGWADNEVNRILCETLLRRSVVSWDAPGPSRGSSGPREGHWAFSEKLPRSEGGVTKTVWQRFSTTTKAVPTTAQSSLAAGGLIFSGSPPPPASLLPPPLWGGHQSAQGVACATALSLSLRPSHQSCQVWLFRGQKPNLSFF